MIKFKEFYAEVRSMWGIVKGVDELINEFLEKHKNIEIIDIKYAAGPVGDASQTFALIIYKESE